MDVESMDIQQIREALIAKEKQVKALRRALGLCISLAICFGPDEEQSNYDVFLEEMEKLNKIYLENL